MLKKVHDPDVLSLEDPSTDIHKLLKFLKQVIAEGGDISAIVSNIDANILNEEPIDCLEMDTQPSSAQVELVFERLRRECAAGLRPDPSCLNFQMPRAVRSSVSTADQSLPGATDTAGSLQLDKCGKVIFGLQHFQPSAGPYDEIEVAIQIRRPGLSHYVCFLNLTAIWKTQSRGKTLGEYFCEREDSILTVFQKFCENKNVPWTHLIKNVNSTARTQRKASFDSRVWQCTTLFLLLLSAFQLSPHNCTPVACRWNFGLLRCFCELLDSTFDLQVSVAPNLIIHVVAGRVSCMRLQPIFNYYNLFTIWNHPKGVQLPKFEDGESVPLFCVLFVAFCSHRLSGAHTRLVYCLIHQV